VAGHGVVVGIIDTGLDLTHADLRQADGTTRVAWLLDLSRPALGKHPDVEKAFGCSEEGQAPCAVLSSQDIQDEMTAGSTLSSRDVVGHGTHVASIAAGNGGREGVYVGMAPAATLVGVRVTRSTATAITDVDVLNAVRFVFDRARALGQPAVVNISLGGDFGPHDGTSPIERGLAAYVGPDQPGRVIVTAVGNSGALCVTNDALPFGNHTEVRVLPHATFRLPLRSIVSNGSEQAGVYVWITLQAGDRVAVGFEHQGKTLLEPLPPGKTSSVRETLPGGTVEVGVLNGVVGQNSPLTAGSYGAVVTFQGTWPSSDEFAITLQGQGTAQAWVQGLSSSEQAGCQGMLFPKALKQGTVTVPASHPSLLAVGCSLNRLSWTDATGQDIEIAQVGATPRPTADSACYFSSAGPNALGAPKPEITAPGGFVAAAMSRNANPTVSPASMFADTLGVCPQASPCLVVDSTHAIASGTSMSAPHVAGAVALLLEKEPTLTQSEVTALLQAGSRRLQGVATYEFQTGPGALDVPGALAALAERGQPRGWIPDRAHSRWQLSSAFARPDGRSEVVGTLILRASDDGPADGFDPAPLHLELRHARLVTPLTRQGPGLWKFSVVAPSGTGTKQMSLAVWYGDTRLGEEKTLPITPDAWALESPPSLASSCSMPSPQAAPSFLGGIAWWVAAAVWARGWFRKRTS